MEKFCCIKCFSESNIIEFIKDQELTGNCDYCGSKNVAICKVKDVGSFIMEGIDRYYENAVEEVGYDSEEGGYFLPTYDIYEILKHEQDIFSDFLGDSDLLISDLIDDDSIAYVCQNPYGPPPGDPDEIRYWENFCHIVKTKQRFSTFLSHDKDDPYDYNNPGNFLLHLSASFIPSLVIPIPAGTQLYRARIKKGDKRLRHRDLTSPKAEISRNNRMSPAGISFFYGAMDAETCIHEVRPDTSDIITVGKFEVLKKLLILDLTFEIEEPLNIFNPNYSFDYEEFYKLFLSHFINSVSKPIRKSDNEIEYIPTQVFTDFLKSKKFKINYLNFDEEDEKSKMFIDGILYNSSLNKTGKNIVLFRGSDISMKSKKDEREQWLLYQGSKEYQVDEISVKSSRIKK